MIKLLTDKKQQTRERIIKAAVELFHEKGYEATTVKEITERASVAKGTYFNYFPTKESIMQSLAEERLIQALPYIQQKKYHALTLQQKIKVFLLHLLVDYDIDPSLTTKIWIHTISSGNSLIEHWENLIKNEMEKNELIKNVDITTWAHILNSQFLYALMFSLTPTSGKEQFIRETMKRMDTCLQGITEKRGNQRMDKKQVVVLGGGYGGMRILQRLLTHDLPTDVEITLIDKMPYHCLKTEYYALAAGTESDQHLRVNFPSDPRLNVMYKKIKEIDLESKLVHLENAEPLTYDTLIIGLGCEDKYHNVPGAAEHTLSIQSMEATRRTFEVISNLRPNAVVSIVGAGLSGVEVASELRESRSDLTIKLFDRGEIVLSMFPRRLSNYVQNWFINHGVEVINKSNITNVEAGALYNHGEKIESDAIIWTAGIQPNKVVRELEVEKDEQGRVKLTPHHHLPNDENVFVVGDCASLQHAPSAQLAEGQAEQIVYVLKKRWKGEAIPAQLPKIKLKGVLGSLGKKHGFGLMGETTLTGRFARVLKSGVLWMYKYHSG